MIIEQKLADIGEGIHEAEIIQWYIEVGDIIKENETIVEIHTEKVNTEITSPVTGKIISIEKNEGEIVKVGEVMVRIETEEVPEKEQEKKQKSEREKEEIEEKEKDPSLFKPSMPFKRTQPKKETTKVQTEKVLAAPAVRRRAREQGVDLHYVKGTGPAGRITQEDLKNYLEMRKTKDKKPTPTKDTVQGTKERIPLRGIRRTISKAMRNSKDRVAHYTYFDEVDMTAFDNLRKKAKPMAEEKGTKVTYLALIIKALTPALQKFPLMNASLDEDNEEIIIKNYYNIGIAVDTDDGLVVPVIKNADQKNVWELSREILDLATRAREGNLELDEVSGGTFTITSIGNIGGMMATPIVNWPEVAILGLTKAKMRPIAVKEDDKWKVEIRKIMYLSLSLDHRVVDGAVGARFTNELIKYIENPDLLILN